MTAEPIVGKGHSGFFDNAPFYRLKRPAEENFGVNRLNHRYDRIIGQNIDYVKGKRILDLACHNGRWGWAALKSGASYVLGIEGRQESIDQGIPFFKEFDSSSYEFIRGNIIDILDQGVPSRHGEFNTIFCLGIYYHIIDHYRLFKRMAEMNPDCIIMDSHVIESKTPLTAWSREKVDMPLRAIADRDGQTHAIVGMVSLGTLTMLASMFGFDMSFATWDRGNIKHSLGLADYLESQPMKGALFESASPPLTFKRFTMIFKRR